MNIYFCLFIFVVFFCMFVFFVLFCYPTFDPIYQLIFTFIKQPQTVCKNLSFVKGIYVVGKKMTIYGRKMAIYLSQIWNFGSTFPKFCMHGPNPLRCGDKILKKGNLVEPIKVSSSYHLCVKCFLQLSFDSEVYTKLLLILYTLLNQMRIVKNIRHKDETMNSL